ILAGVPLALPALLRAEKLGKRAASTKFDWPAARAVLEKAREEVDEIESAVAAGEAEARLSHEIGDLLVAVAQLARHRKVNPETALRDTNARFERRLRHIEERLAAQGRGPRDADLDELEALWGEAKRAEAGKSAR